MREFVTLKKSDPIFMSYLLGTFAKDRRALPVKTLNANSDFELVTFEVFTLPLATNETWLARVTEIFKLKTFIFVAFPIFLVLAKLFVDGVQFSAGVAAITTLAIFALFVSANFRNDFLDHIRGLDRIHPQSSIRPIQKGWLTAQQALNASHYFVFTGFLLAVPALLAQPALLIILAVLTGAGLVGLYSYKFGLKYRSWSEVVVLCFTGPLLTVGFEISMTGKFDLETVWLGMLSGALTFFLLNLKNLKNLMVNYKAGFKNTMTSLGFERAKKMLLFWHLIFLLFFTIYHVVYGGLVWGFCMAILSCLSAIRFLTCLAKLKSPLGSLNNDLESAGQSWIFATLVFWTLQIFWQMSFVVSP